MSSVGSEAQRLSAGGASFRVLTGRDNTQDSCVREENGIDARLVAYW